MKKTIRNSLIAAALAVAVGCSTREITFGEATYKSKRFGVKETFGKISASTVTKGGTNTLTVDGVQSDLVTGIKATAEAVGSAVAEAVKTVAKPK